MPAGTHQQTIDFDRATRRGILRRAKLPDDRRAKDGTLVNAQRLWATLTVIEDHGRARDCFPSVRTIASEARQSVRTTHRVLEVLESAGLIVRERKRPWNAAHDDRRTLLHYTIVWSELSILVPRPGEGSLRIAEEADLGVGQKPLNHPGKPGGERDQSAVAEYQSAVAEYQSAVGAPLREQTGGATRGATAPPPLPPADQQDWAAAEVAVQGVKDRQGQTLTWWRESIAEARRAGLTPAAVLEAVEEFEANRTRFASIGALRRRLQGHPWPVEGVRPAPVVRELRAAAARAAADQQAAAAAAAREAGDRRRQLADLEAAYGAELDALGADEAEELACCAFGSAFEREHWRRSRGEYGRYERLLVIHAARAAAETEVRRDAGRVGAVGR